MSLPEGAAPVLDRGFVRLVDSMGGDAGVLTAARVSYASTSKGEEKDRKLISYLLRHEHMTPFEHAVFKFHVSCPIFVMRQWIRHRAGCLTGDTELWFDLPSGPARGRRKSYRMSIEEFHRKWHEGARPIPHAKRLGSFVAIPQRPRLARMHLRSLNEQTWTFRHTRILDIFKTGEKPTFEVGLDDGRLIRCTKDHRFLFEGGWKTLAAETGLELTGELATYRGDGLPRLCVNGRQVSQPLYRDKEWLERQYRMPDADDDGIAAMLGVSRHVIRKWRKVAKPLARVTKMIPKWARIASIRYLGVLPTYDLTVEGPFHNYVANGIVTHNSFNEISARYTEVQDEFYLPGQWRAPDPKNKQASQPAPAIDQARCARLLQEAYDKSYAVYKELLSLGAARELARMSLPVSLYTQFYWTVSARNLMHFINLRADAPAQWEIQRYAEALSDIFARSMPWTWEAFLRHAWKGSNPRLDGMRGKLAPEAAA